MNFFSKVKAAMSNVASRRGVFATFFNILYPFLPFNPKEYYTSWVFTAINLIAEQVSTIEIKLQKKNAKGDWEDVIDHPALSLLKKVNPEMTSSQLFHSVASWCEAEGNAFWLVFYNGKGEPAELWPLDSTRVYIHTDADGMIDGYQILTERGDLKDFAKNEVIHFKRYNIKDRLRGMGTIEAVRLEADTDTHASEYNRNFYFNSAMPGAILQTDKNLSPEQVNEIRNQWNMRYQGSANAYKTGILHSGLKFLTPTINQKDMQYLEQRRFSRDTVFQMFRIPTPLGGIVEDANRANLEGAEYVFAKYRIKPYMEFIIDMLNEFYLLLWNLSQEEYRFALAVDPVPDNDELTLKKKETALNTGYKTRNEIRSEEGLDPVEGGDVLYIPASYVPIGTPPQSINPTGGNNGGKSKTKMVKKKLDPVAQGLKTLLNENLENSSEKYKVFLNDVKKSLLNKLKNSKKIKPIKLNRKDFIDPILYIAKARILKKEQGEEMVKLLFENWDEWIGILYDSLKDDEELAMEYGGNIALQRVDVATKFDMENDKAQAWIEDTALKNAKSIVGSLKDDLRPVILDAASAGEGSQGVADALAEHFSLLEDWKALQIARSEMCNAYSQGTLEGYRQSDVVEMKEWYTGGANPCQICQDNEAEGPIPLNDEFSSRDDAPGAHPNDECTLLPVVSND